MLIIGIILIIISIVLLVSFLGDFEWKGNIFLIFILLIGIGLVSYEVTSPIEVVKTKYWWANDLENKNITFVGICQIIERKMESTRRFCILKEETHYIINCHDKGIK